MNRRPKAYESSALPLSYSGKNRLFTTTCKQNEAVKDWLVKPEFVTLRFRVVLQQPNRSGRPALPVFNKVGEHHYRLDSLDTLAVSQKSGQAVSPFTLHSNEPLIRWVNPPVPVRLAGRNGSRFVPALARRRRHRLRAAHGAGGAVTYREAGARGAGRFVNGCAGGPRAHRGPVPGPVIPRLRRARAGPRPGRQATRRAKNHQTDDHPAPRPLDGRPLVTAALP
ncbi:MAG: hypothetical protein RL077_1879 [Verrucomicrobiota bacterium]